MGLKSKPLENLRTDIPVAGVIREDLARININVPMSLRKEWKAVALEMDITLTELLIEAMKHYKEIHLSQK